MSASRLAIDPLWQCLCPSWTSTIPRTASRLATQSRRPAIKSLRPPRMIRHKTDAEIRKYESFQSNIPDRGEPVLSPLARSVPYRPLMPTPSRRATNDNSPIIEWQKESTQSLYTHMRGLAIDGKWESCRELAEMLVRDRGEKPSTQLYDLLILSNCGHEQGTGWRVLDLLEEMEQDGLQPDSRTCHAVLKVLAMHPDHLLRSDILDYMNQRWIPVTEDGAHDIAAGLFRDGLFEQALERLEQMKQEDMRIQGWLLDMAVWTLCEASEIGEALRIMRQRVDTHEPNISRSLWEFFLDKASDARHHAATSLAWSSQVEQRYINPSSGLCLNVLATAARAADATMATDVFTLLSKRGAAFQPIHYELLMETYLSTDPPDLPRSLAILTIMALEKIEPTPAETRNLFMYMRDKPEAPTQAIQVLRDLHEKGRKIPIAALNVIIESYVEQGNFRAAMNLYKQIHTFAPIAEGAKRSFANIETFNMLLKGCRSTKPPDEQEASFLVSELLALRIQPTALTYDRLILLFVKAGTYKLYGGTLASNHNKEEEAVKLRTRGKELLDWAFRHFSEMHPLAWLPRLGTIEELAVALAGVGDARCWEVVQAAEDGAKMIAGWDMKGAFVTRKVDQAWEKATAQEKVYDKAGLDGAAAEG